MTYPNPTFQSHCASSQSAASDELSPRELDEPGEYPDDIEVPWSDEAFWDVFIPDDDELDPQPELGDFWIEDPEELRASTQEAVFR